MWLLEQASAYGGRKHDLIHTSHNLCKDGTVSILILQIRKVRHKGQTRKKNPAQATCFSHHTVSLSPQAVTQLAVEQGEWVPDTNKGLSHGVTVASLLTCPEPCWLAYSSRTLEPRSDGNTECKRGWRRWQQGSPRDSQRSHFAQESYNGPVGRNVWELSGRSICSSHPVPITSASHFPAI